LPALFKNRKVQSKVTIAPLRDPQVPDSVRADLRRAGSERPGRGRRLTGFRVLAHEGAAGSLPRNMSFTPVPVPIETEPESPLDIHGIGGHPRGLTHAFLHRNVGALLLLRHAGAAHALPW